MASVDIIMPSARGAEEETRITLLEMINHNQCRCGTHPPDKCNKGKHDIVWLPPFGTSVIHWTRNFVVAMALYGPRVSNRGPADYILMMDDDMVVKNGMLSRLLMHKLDIVGGVCTSRRDPPIPNIRYWIPDKRAFRTPIDWEWNSQKLIEVDGIGTAFVLAKRKVFEDMADAYLECKFEIDEDLRKGYPEDAVNKYWQAKSAIRKSRFAVDDWKKKDCWWFQFLDNVDDGQVGELGEDLSWCVKAKRLGYKVYADPQVQPGHIGKYAYNLQDHIGFVEAAKAKGDIIEMSDNNPLFEQPIRVIEKKP